MLGVTALAQAYVWKTGLEREGAQIALWAQHGLSVQRYARLVCLLYGSDPKRNGWLVEAAEHGGDPGRELRGRMEYRRARGSVGARYLRHPAGASARRGPLPRSASSMRSLSTPTKPRLAELIQGRQLLEKLGQQMQSSFRIPRASYAEAQPLRGAECVLGR